MGVIQGSINNFFTQTGYIASLSPSLQDLSKKRSELKSLSNKETLVQRREKLGSITEQEAAAEMASIAEERAVLKPTEQNVEAAYDRATESMIQDLKAEKREKAQQKAEEDLRIKQEEKQRSEQFRQMFTEGGRYR